MIKRLFLHLILATTVAQVRPVSVSAAQPGTDRLIAVVKNLEPQGKLVKLTGPNRQGHYGVYWLTSQGYVKSFCLDGQSGLLIGELTKISQQDQKSCMGL